MQRNYEYTHRIDNPLAAASRYHLEKLRREAAQVRIADLTNKASPARNRRLIDTLGRAWNRLWARQSGTLLRAPSPKR